MRIESRIDFLDGLVGLEPCYFDIGNGLPDYLVELYKVFGNDLPVFNDAHWTLPMPARYVIGQDGTILYSEVSPDYAKRPDPSELFPAFDKAG